LVSLYSNVLRLTEYSNIPAKCAPTRNGPARYTFSEGCDTSGLYFIGSNPGAFTATLAADEIGMAYADEIEATAGAIGAQLDSLVDYLTYLLQKVE
jgi:hypothetical protein